MTFTDHKEEKLLKKTPVETYLKVIKSFDSGLIGHVLKIIQTSMHVSV